MSKPEAAGFDRPHMPLAKYRVLYIGRAAPKASLDSLDAIQKPLCELFTKDEYQSRDTDVDAVLTILTSGLLMEPVDPLDKDLWLPIQNLQSCAAVKAVIAPLNVCGNGDVAELSFAPLDSPQASGSSYPPIFSCVMGRSNGLPLTDCFAFICQSKEDAMMTVQATMFAFGNREGWATDRPSKATLAAFSAASQGRQEGKVVISDMYDDTPVEFYEKPPIGGFFYTPNPGLIQRFSIQGDGCSSHGDRRSPYVPEQPQPAPTPAPAPAPNPPVNPMIFYETEQDFLYLDQPVGVQYPTFSAPRSAPSSNFGGAGAASQAIAFNPYLDPSLDPPVEVQTPVVQPPIAKAVTPMVPREQIIMVPMVPREEVPRDPVINPLIQEQFAYAPRTHAGISDEPVYQKRLPRSNIGVPQTYTNQDTQPARFGDRATNRPAANPFPVSKQPTEELYSHRLPPPIQEALPSGAKQFDSNFILRQSDTDKARLADVENHEGYPVARPINIAEFGY